MQRLVLALSLAATVGACAPRPGTIGYSGGGYSSRAPGPENSVVKVEDSNFEPRIRFIGIDTMDRPGSLHGTYFRQWMLRSWLEKATDRVSHQLYYSELYNSNGWRYWHSANDERANSLRFVSIARDVNSCTGSRYGGGCSYTEIFGADVDDATLREARDKGRTYCVKFYARSGDETFACLSNQQIAAQLDAIDARRPRPAPAAAPQQPSRQRQPAARRAASRPSPQDQPSTAPR